MSTSIEDPEAAENAKIVCAHCGKQVRYERPHFCPFCGKEIDSTSGLEVASEEAEIYPSSNVAPLLMRLFLWWLVLAFLGTAIFGRIALMITSVLFLLIALLLGLSSLVFHKKSSKDNA